MLLEVHLLWICALSVQGLPSPDQDNGEIAIICLDL